MEAISSARWLAAALLVAILAGGSYTRIAHLGQRDFNVDELNHLYAARSLQNDIGPELPSGNDYRRAGDISRMVAVTRSFVPRDTTATRLPSALFGILSLLLFAAIAWSIGGPWAAVWASVLLAIYPEAITQSRLGRFYTYQLLFGLLALYAGWRCLRDSGGERRPEPDDVRRQWLWGASAALLLLLGARVQPTTLSVAAGFGVCVAAAAALDAWRRGWDPKRSVPLQMLVLGALGLAAFLALRPEFLERVRMATGFAPLWAGETHGGALTYYYAFYDDFPLLVALAPVVYLYLAVRRPRLAGYLFLWFVVPVALHTFVFAWKGERFVLLAAPALFLAGALAAADGAGALYRRLAGRLARGDVASLSSRVVAGCVVGVAAAFAVASSPAHNAVVDAVRPDEESSWSAAAEILTSIPGHEFLPVGSSMPLNGLYYFDRVDFVVGRGFLEKPAEGTDRLVRYDQGTPDYYAGAPTLTTPEAIRERFPDADSLLIGIDRNQWRFGNIVPELKAALLSEGEELCDGACEEVALYLWIPRDDS